MHLAVWRYDAGCRLGASGFGYQVASQFGHSIVPTEAALVPFTFTDATGDLIKSQAGLSLDVTASNDKISFCRDDAFGS